MVTDVVRTKLQPYLQTLPVTSEIDIVSGIDYSLVGPPVATNHSLDLNLKGEFFSLTHRSAAPFTPPALNFPMDHDRMLYFGVSSHLFNTAIYVYYQARLSFTIKDDMVPQDSSVRLNTTYLQIIVPQVAKLYHNLPMKLKVSPASAPALSITPEGLSLSLTLDVKAFAILPNSSLAPLFVLAASTNISATAAIEDNGIVGSLKMGSLQLSLKHSSVGPFPMAPMQQAVSYLATKVLLPPINERLQQGLPLPLPDDLRLSNLVFQPHQNFLLFGADVRYMVKMPKTARETAKA